MCLAMADVEDDLVIPLNALPDQDWPAPTTTVGSSPPASPYVERKLQSVRCRRRRVGGESTPGIGPPLESALTVLADQSNRAHAMQMQLMLLGASMSHGLVTRRPTPVTGRILVPIPVRHRLILPLQHPSPLSKSPCLRLFL